MRIVVHPEKESNAEFIYTKNEKRRVQGSEKMKNENFEELS
jgi:hypothetical protein